MLQKGTFVLPPGTSVHSSRPLSTLSLYYQFNKTELKQIEKQIKYNLFFLFISKNFLIKKKNNHVKRNSSSRP